MATRNGGRGRADSDEFYVIDPCDEVLGVAAQRQHKFPWLVGDPSPKTGRAAGLPVDAYWPTRKLVVEFYERQHSEAVPFFDRPDRLTVSGVARGDQRALYDERPRQLIPNTASGWRSSRSTTSRTSAANSFATMSGTSTWSPSCLLSGGAVPPRPECAARGVDRHPSAQSMGAGR